MAVKHLKAYYEDVCQQRQELIKELKNFEQEAVTRVIEPERIEAVKEVSVPLMRNYETLSWVMYLLNKSIDSLRDDYNSLCKQRFELLLEIKDFEQEVEEGYITLERLNEIKESIQPTLNTYNTMSWIMVMLDSPARKNKTKKYNRCIKPFTSQLDINYNKENTLLTNKLTLEKVRETLYN